MTNDQPLAEILHALLAGDRRTRPLARPGIRLGALTAARQVLAMPFAAVALDFLEARDVRTFQAAERPFDQIFLVEQNRDLGNLLVGEFFRPSLWIDLELLTYFQRGRRPDPANVAQGDVGRLIRRNVNALNTGHM